jgi:hypothetical protein
LSQLVSELFSSCFLDALYLVFDTAYDVPTGLKILTGGSCSTSTKDVILEDAATQLVIMAEWGQGRGGSSQCVKLEFSEEGLPDKKERDKILF